MVIRFAGKRDGWVSSALVVALPAAQRTLFPENPLETHTLRGVAMRNISPALFLGFHSLGPGEVCAVEMRTEEVRFLEVGTGKVRAGQDALEEICS